MMDVSSLLSLSAGREVAQLTIVDEVLRIDVVATAEGRACPLCAEVATHVRSYYTRAVADLPCAGHRVQLMLQVRKFRCDTASCPRKVFAERLGPFIEAWAHKTARLRKAIESIGLATCREGGARLASPRRASGNVHVANHRALFYHGLAAPSRRTYFSPWNDFALHCGRTYGTVLVD